MLTQKRKILFAILNWGLGHATRSCELINQYIQNGDEVVLASDGVALDFLKKEFPNLQALELPGYNAVYSASGGAFAMMKNGIKTQIAVKKEQKWLKQLLKNESFDLIISDNRYGIYSNAIKSIIITHQLNIKAPFLSGIVNRQNHAWLNNFEEIWVPDKNGELSGELSRPVPELLLNKVKEIGMLSRFKTCDKIAQEDLILAIVSGPEPQKTILCNQLKTILQQLDKEAILYNGNPAQSGVEQNGKLTIKNHASTNEFVNDLSRAKIVIGRSGYSSLMDYVVLNKQMVLIPTPGQDEQLYLSNYLSNNDKVTVVSQENLNFANLKKVIIE